MSSNEPESLSEREFAHELEDQMGEILGLTPRAEEQEVVEDAPPRPPEAPSVDDEPGEEAPTEEEGEPEAPGEEGLAWARRKYGDDVTLEKIAQAAFDQEQTISRLGTRAREQEQLARDWYEHSQMQEQAMRQQPTGLPMSAAEEQWVENAVVNPLQAAMQAKAAGNEGLYRSVINRISQEDPVTAGQVAAYVEQAAMQAAAQQAASQQQAQNGESQEAQIHGSLQRLGIDINAYGKPMMQRIGEMGEYHPFTQAILYGSNDERDLAFQALYDIVREGNVTRRVVRDTEREEQLRKEGDLRRQAAGVLTGGPRSSTPPPQSPFMDAMEAEWRRRGQWQDEE